MKKRHLERTICWSKKLSSFRAGMMNPVVVNKYFTDQEQIVKALNLENKPYCIWNMDETGRSFQHTPVRVISDTLSETTATVGQWMPSMFVEKRQNIFLTAWLQHRCSSSREHLELSGKWVDDNGTRGEVVLKCFLERMWTGTTTGSHP